MDGQPAYCYTPGRIPILLSAPHGAIHTRDGRRKGEDEYTAGFARLIAELTDAHVIYAHRRSHTDPNWYPYTSYKERLKKVVEKAGIGFVLDIHGAAARWDFGIALGTIAGESCPNHQTLIVEHLAAHGFDRSAVDLDRLAVNHPRFTGGKRQATVTRFAWRELRVPAAQFELNAYLRTVARILDVAGDKPFYGDVWRIERAVHAFVHLVRALALS